MNEMWRRMTLTLVLCVLLFHSCLGQNDGTAAPDDIQQGGSTNAPDISQNTANPTSMPASNIPDVLTATYVPAGAESPQTIIQDKSSEATVKGDIAAPTGGHDGIIKKSEENILKMFHIDDSVTTKTSNPEINAQPQKSTVTCVEKNKTMNREAAILELESPSNCSATAKAIEAKMETLCNKQFCTFEIFQEENSKHVIMTGKGVDGDLAGMGKRIDSIKSDLGVSETSVRNGKQTSHVLVSLLVTGLAGAALLIGAYLWKNHCRTSGKNIKLGEESMMADEVNQGDTLVSVTPLNPPESQEKPSQNGESPEAVKTQTPPAATNGHSTTKTADTEL